MPFVNWLSYQRHEAKLKEWQRKDLESIGYKSTEVCRMRDNDAWESRFNDVKANRHYGDPKLSKWLYRQYLSFKTDQLLPSRREKFKELNENLLKECERKCQGRASKSMKFEAAWQKNYEELKEYYNKYGDSDVPRRYKENPSLGNWVNNQRSKYHKKRPDGSRFLDDDRIKLLQAVEFKWEVHRRL